jgi:glycosyltransferase involved in cell wall biosynthesis
MASPEEAHCVLTLFAAPPAVLRPEFSLGVGAGRLRGLGLDPRVVWRLRRWLALHRPDIVVAHGGEPYKYATLSSLGRVPVVYYRIGAVLPGALRPPGRWWHSLIIRRAATVVCVSEDLRRETADLFRLPLDDMVVIPNARDEVRYRPAPPTMAGPCTVGFVGQLMPSKRPEWLLDAVGRLQQDGLEVRGTIVGEGPLEGVLRAHPAAPAVHFVGRSDDVPTLLRTFDVLLLASTRQEGMPGVLIEAGLTGLPVVATDVPGVREIVPSGLTGFVVSPDGPEEAFYALRTLVDNKELRLRMGEAARRHCETRFGLNASVRSWRVVLAGAGRARLRGGGQSCRA